MADIETCLAQMAGAAVRKAERDELIRLATLFARSPEPYAQAGELAREAKALARMRNTSARRRPIDEPTNMRECLDAAAQFAKLPSSQRQFHRVLTKEHL